MLLLVTPGELFVVMGIMFGWIVFTALIEYLIIKPFLSLKGLFPKPDPLKRVQKYRQKLGYEVETPKPIDRIREYRNSLGYDDATPRYDRDD